MTQESNAETITFIHGQGTEESDTDGVTGPEKDLDEDKKPNEDDSKDEIEEEEESTVE